MRIGTNLRRERKKADISQKQLAERAHMNPSTLSRIEENLQDAKWEQVEAFAQILGIATEALTRQDAPVFNSTNQQGGSANNYHIHNGDPANENIELLKEQNQWLRQEFEKDRLERAKSEEKLQKLLENQQSLQETLIKIMAKVFPEK